MAKKCHLSIGCLRSTLQVNLILTETCFFQNFGFGQKIESFSFLCLGKRLNFKTKIYKQNTTNFVYFSTENSLKFLFSISNLSGLVITILLELNLKEKIELYKIYK